MLIVNVRRQRAVAAALRRPLPDRERCSAFQRFARATLRGGAA